MSSRLAETYPASIGATALESRERRLACIASCISSSVGMPGIPARVVNQMVRMGRLMKQNLQRWHFVIPFDQRRHCTEAHQRLLIQPPDLVADPRAVIVDAKSGAVGQGLDAVSSQMDLADRIRWQGCDIGRGVPAVIVGADAD